MKTEEEWKDELVLVSDDSAPESVMEIVKEIQLDAMKEGMRRAAKLVATTPCWSDDILTAAEQLTINDL